ncbi:hypothetical protein BD310DRAFT_908749 [Dichomitus squalens]|uniref:Uncharacterized protein n=1 Tax=Dichomitus squalens TaxID=114155 RepID=A0A4Q9PKV1_9APHY|nr:hypothetical protein BD310DRAFT_908749 [Dichomitus squalens]
MVLRLQAFCLLTDALRADDEIVGTEAVTNRDLPRSVLKPDSKSVGTRAGSVYTQGKRITLDAPGGDSTPPLSQRYWMIIVIPEQPVADVDNLRELLCDGAARLPYPVSYMQEVDCGSNTTYVPVVSSS